MGPQRKRKSPLMRHTKIRNSKYNIPKKKRGSVSSGTVKSNTADRLGTIREILSPNDSSDSSSSPAKTTTSDSDASTPTHRLFSTVRKTSPRVEHKKTVSFSRQKAVLKAPPPTPNLPPATRPTPAPVHTPAIKNDDIDERPAKKMKTCVATQTSRKPPRKRTPTPPPSPPTSRDPKRYIHPKEILRFRWLRDKAKDHPKEENDSLKMQPQQLLGEVFRSTARMGEAVSERCVREVEREIEKLRYRSDAIRLLNLLRRQGHDFHNSVRSKIKNHLGGLVANGLIVRHRSKVEKEANPLCYERLDTRNCMIVGHYWSRLRKFIDDVTISKLREDQIPDHISGDDIAHALGLLETLTSLHTLF